MHIRLAVLTAVLCGASYGCATPADEPAAKASAPNAATADAPQPAPQSRPIRTGSRLPSYEDQGGSSSVGDQSKDDFADQMRRGGGGTSGK